MPREKFKNWEKPKLEDRKLHPKYYFLVQYKENLELGENTDIGAFTYINAKYGVVIKKDVQIGSHCSIYTHSTIDRKKGMSDRYETFRRIFGCTTKDGLKNSVFIDVAALRISDVPLPTNVKGKKNTTGKALIEGAIVIRPKAGIHGAMPE